MIIYVPKEVVSVEEAEALPVGSVVFTDLGAGGEVFAGSKIGINCWRTNSYSYHALDCSDYDVVGWTYLREIDVLDSLVSVVAERSEFHSIDEVRRRLGEQK